MKYEIVMTKEAKDDLYAIYRYIAVELVAKETAQKQIDRLEEGIEGLTFMPEKFCVYNRQKWPTLRMTLVDNYSVFYEVSQNMFRVSIVRILYGRRDFDVILDT